MVFSRTAVKLFFVITATSILGWLAGSEFVAMTATSIRPSVASSSKNSLKDADYDWSLKTLDGKDFNLAQTKGKIVFINIWATWCPPCRAELPSLQRLNDKFKDKVVFAFVSYENESEIKTFMTRNHYNFPAYSDHDIRPAAYSSYGIPNTLIISTEGKIVFKHYGAMDWDDQKNITILQNLIGKE